MATVAQANPSDSGTGQEQATAYRQWPRPDFSPCTRMSWHEVLYMHWPLQPCHLQSLIPEGLELDTREGVAWVGIVPFRLSGVAARWLPPLPLISRFPEVTVRTYVTMGGKPGLWYFSLDATNPFAVFLAKCVFALPYNEASISLVNDGLWKRFRCQRRCPEQGPAELDVEYRPVGPTYQTREGTLEHFLTARYCIYTRDKSGELLRGEIDHPPLKLRNAQAIIHRNTMLQSLGLALPDQCPRLMYVHHTRVGSWRNQKAGCTLRSC